MSINSNSFESVAKDIKAYYGCQYDDILIEQTNKKIKPESDEAIYYTSEEKEKIFAENYRLIYHVANKYVIRGGIDREELYHSGLLGMVKALNTYDKNMGEAKFSTYAIRVITNEILYFMRRERKHREDDTGKSLRHLEERLDSGHYGEYFEVGHTIEDDTIPELDKGVFDSELSEVTMEFLKRALNEDELFVIIWRHGLNNIEKIMTQREIGEIMGMSQANVSKIQQNAEEKLYRYLVGVTDNENLTVDEAIDVISGLNLRRRTVLNHLKKNE